MPARNTETGTGTGTATTIVLRDEQGREFAYDESARKFVGRQSGGVQTLEAINKIAAGIVFCGRGWERQHGETSAAVAAGRLGLVVEYQAEPKPEPATEPPPEDLRPTKAEFGPVLRLG